MNNKRRSDFFINYFVRACISLSTAQLLLSNKDIFEMSAIICLPLIVAYTIRWYVARWNWIKQRYVDTELMILLLTFYALFYALFLGCGFYIGFYINRYLFILYVFLTCLACYFVVKSTPFLADKTLEILESQTIINNQLNLENTFKDEILVDKSQSKKVVFLATFLLKSFGAFYIGLILYHGIKSGEIPGYNVPVVKYLSINAILNIVAGFALFTMYGFFKSSHLFLSRLLAVKKWQEKNQSRLILDDYVIKT